MKRSRNITGLGKLLFYARMSLACAWRYKSPSVLLKASRFTRVFFRHKLVKMASGAYKLDFYMPRYPSAAFFTALEDKVVRRPPRPVTVVLSISKACAYRCPHCYQRKDDPNELPLDTLVENVRKMRDFGIVAWAVEGGEPMLRFERLEAVLKEIQGLEVWVNSTGHGATPEKIRRMRELGVTGVMSSIHSVDPSEHDAFTGMPGSWQRALDFLQTCQEEGMLVGFNTVLSDRQVVEGGIDRIMDLATEHGCDYIQLIHPKACGAWMGKTFDASLHREAVEIAKAAQVRYNASGSRHTPVLTAQVYEESPEIEEARERARSARGYETVVACGGDGTIRAVAEGVLENPDERLKFGVLYMGTSPDFCRAHAIPTDTENALRLLRVGKTRELPVLMANGRVFLCSLNLGIGAAVAEAANRLRPKLGDGLGTFVALLRALFRARAYDLQVGAERLSSRLHVLVTRIPYIVGGLRLSLPDLKKDEYAVWSVVRPSFWGWPRLLWRLYRGKTCGMFHVLRGPVRLAAVEPMAVEFDGDPQGNLPVVIRFAEQTLKLISP